MCSQQRAKASTSTADVYEWQVGDVVQQSRTPTPRGSGLPAPVSTLIILVLTTHRKAGCTEMLGLDRPLDRERPREEDDSSDSPGKFGGP